MQEKDSGKEVFRYTTAAAAVGSLRTSSQDTEKRIEEQLKAAEKGSAREFMWRKLKERKERVRREDLDKAAKADRSPVAKLLNVWSEIALIGLVVVLLVSGIMIVAQESIVLGVMVIIVSVVFMVAILLNHLFQGYLLRTAWIVINMGGAVLLWAVDNMVYPVRRLSGWRILSEGMPEAERRQFAYSQEEGGVVFPQLSLSIYASGEKPLLGRRFMIAFQNLGPAFIKLGQMLSMGAVLPRSWLAEFSKLCDYLPTEKYETVVERIEHEVGTNIKEICQYIDPQPIGAASLAQVHCVVMKDGRDAVIKVQRPGLRDRFMRDYIILSTMASFVDVAFRVLGILPQLKVLRQFSPAEIVHDYGWVTMVTELDFAVEATSMQMIHNILERHGLLDSLHVPTVYWDYTTEDIITMERVWTYFKFVDMDIAERDEMSTFLDTMRSIGFDLRVSTKKAYRGWWYPFSRYGLMNMDVHHGNFLIGYNSTLSLVDFGINHWAGANESAEKTRAGLTQFWKGAMSADYREVAEAARGNLGLLQGFDSDKAVDMVTAEFKDLLEPMTRFKERQGVLGKETVSDFHEDITSGAFWTAFLGAFMKLGSEGGVRLGYDFLAVLRMIPYWTTIMEIVDPTWDMFSEGDSLNSYLFGVDCTVPFKGTEEYPYPLLKHEPELWVNARSEEQQMFEDYDLCYASEW